jgi:hypothetical protein
MREADYIVDVDGKTPEQIAVEIVEMIKTNGTGMQ